MARDIFTEVETVAHVRVSQGQVLDLNRLGVSLFEIHENAVIADAGELEDRVARASFWGTTEEDQAWIQPIVDGINRGSHAYILLVHR